MIDNTKIRRRGRKSKLLDQTFFDEDHTRCSECDITDVVKGDITVAKIFKLIFSDPSATEKAMYSENLIIREGGGGFGVHDEEGFVVIDNTKIRRDSRKSKP